MHGIRQFVRSKPLASQRGRATFLSLASLSTAALLLWFPLHSRTASAALQDSSTPLVTLRGQSQEDARRKSAGCISCHTATDEPTMHPTKTVQLACADCHGGNSSISVAAGIAPHSSEY